MSMLIAVKKIIKTILPYRVILLCRYIKQTRIVNHKKDIRRNCMDIGKSGTYLFKNPDLNSALTITPPTELMEWGESAEKHLASGKKDFQDIYEILKRNNVSIADLERIFEFGCSNCRILRQFLNFPNSPSLWGADIQVNKVFWAMENLPQLNLIVNNITPPLPFGDGYFGFVYAGSVFTHIVEYHTAWLVELARVIKPGGYACFSFHDEASHKYFTDPSPGWEQKNVDWVAEPIRQDKDIYDNFLRFDFDFLRSGCSYYEGTAQSVVFMSRRYIEKITGQFFELIDLVPNSYGGGQTWYLFRRLK